MKAEEYERDRAVYEQMTAYEIREKKKHYFEQMIIGLIVSIAGIVALFRITGGLEHSTFGRMYYALGLPIFGGIGSALKNLANYLYLIEFASTDAIDSLLNRKQKNGLIQNADYSNNRDIQFERIDAENDNQVFSDTVDNMAQYLNHDSADILFPQKSGRDRKQAEMQKYLKQ